MRNWYELSPAEVISRIYWQRGQIPPKNVDWPAIRRQLIKRDPPPLFKHQAN